MSLNSIFRDWFPSALFKFLACGLLIGVAQAEDKVPLVLQLPKPLFVGTPVQVSLPNLEHPQAGKRPDFLVPKGVVNVALNKKVTSSDSEPLMGDLTLVTDGDKSGDEGCYVELGQGKKWIQIDLGKSIPLYAIVVWHFHSQARVYKDVVVQLSNDSDFLTGVQTIFNNDLTNELGFGVGKDPTYIETYEGRIMDAKGISARYVRLYSNGNTSTSANDYIEVEAYGKP